VENPNPPPRQSDPPAQHRPDFVVVPTGSGSAPYPTTATEEEVLNEEPGRKTTSTTTTTVHGKKDDGDAMSLPRLAGNEDQDHEDNTEADDCPTDDATSTDDGPEQQQEQPTFQKSYAISEKISKGNYGVVYRAVHRTSSTVYAVKVICRAALAKLLEGDAMVLREIDLLQDCRDIENVVKIIEYFRTPRYFYIVQDYAPVRLLVYGFVVATWRCCRSLLRTWMLAIVARIVLVPLAGSLTRLVICCCPPPQNDHIVPHQRQ
jgi:hypothetical protein